MLSEEVSHSYHQQCLVKSKYLGQWKQRTISLDINSKMLSISENGNNSKKYPLKNVELNGNQKLLQMVVDENRTYEVSGENIQALSSTIKEIKELYNVCSFTESNTMLLPKVINYGSMVGNPLITSLLTQPAKQEDATQYPRQQSYLIESDWEINHEDGGLRLISDIKKGYQVRIIKFVLYKFISTGSFMNISYPVFAMKPQSILQTWAKSISAAPLIFKKISKNPVERIKKFICFIFATSRLFADFDKPFNPVVGETFQAEIAGGSFSAQQTSHHPPQSSFYFKGNGYAIYATIQLVASIGVNTAVGRFEGDLNIEFDDGGKIFGLLPKGQMSGFLMGQNLFAPKCHTYVYDPINGICAMYRNKEKDIFRGSIGRLKEKYQKKFLNQLQSNERFKHFEGYKDKEFEEVYSKVRAEWSKDIRFDDEVYFDFLDKSCLPYMPTKVEKNLLPSDSRFRTDIKLREQDLIEEAQTEKERIEQGERDLRKLRQNSKK